MFFLRYSTQRQTSVHKITHEGRHPSLFPSTSVTRQCTATLKTPHFTLPRCFVDRVSFLLSLDNKKVCVPHIFVDNSREDRQVLPRLHTKQVISHFFLQLVSQHSAQQLLTRTISTYLGVSRIEFQFCCLWTRFVSQGVVCLQSVGSGGSWTFTVIFLNISSGSTLFVSLDVIDDPSLLFIINR